MNRFISRLIIIVSISAISLFTTLSYAGIKDYKVIPVNNGGVIKGRILFNGKPPEARKIRIVKNPEVCGEGFREVTWVRVNNGGLAEAVVYLDDIKEGKEWPPVTGEIEHLDDPNGKDTDLASDGKYVIDQKDCRFHPWIRVYKRGADLIVRNSDSVRHNINFREVLVGNVMKTVFNISQNEKGDILQRIKTRRSRFIRINCEPHNFMFSWGFSADNPYAVVVNSDGTYEIADVPPGSYKLIVWHPILGVKRDKVEIHKGGSVQKDFQY
jgi:hypothetical protein